MTGLYKKRLPFLLGILFLLSGCAAARDYAPSPLFEGSARESEKSMAASDRLIVWRASLTLEVDAVGETLPIVSAIIEKKGGHIENKWISGNDKEHARLTIRVPSKELKVVLDEFSRLGREQHRHIASEDVTEKYIDTEARLKNAIALRDRLKGLLDKAKEVKEILAIEKELTRIQSDIDSMEGRLKKLKGQIDFASITLTLEEKRVLGPLGYLFKGIGWIIKKLFVIK